MHTEETIAAMELIKKTWSLFAQLQQWRPSSEEEVAEVGSIVLEMILTLPDEAQAEMFAFSAEAPPPIANDGNVVTREVATQT